MISILSVSSVSAQYVDDLYYNRKDKAQREAELKAQKAEREQAAAERAKTKKFEQQSQKEEGELDDMEYYPGMFADAVNGSSENASKQKKGDSNTTTVELVGIWSPSWYSYGSWGSPFYNPWGRSFWYDPFDPFYSYGWGFNSWNHWGHSSFYWGGYNPYYNWNYGWHRPHYNYGHGHGYYEPRYNRYNTTTGGGRRESGTMVGTSSSNRGSNRGGNYNISNQVRNLDRVTRTNNSRPSNTTNTTRPSQYNRRDTYTPPPTTNSSVGTGGGFRGGSTGTSSGSGSSGSGSGSSGSGAGGRRR